MRARSTLVLTTGLMVVTALGCSDTLGDSDLGKLEVAIELGSGVLPADLAGGTVNAGLWTNGVGVTLVESQSGAIDGAGVPPTLTFAPPPHRTIDIECSAFNAADEPVAHGVALGANSLGRATCVLEALRPSSADLDADFAVDYSGYWVEPTIVEGAPFDCGGGVLSLDMRFEDDDSTFFDLYVLGDPASGGWFPPLAGSLQPFDGFAEVTGLTTNNPMGLYFDLGAVNDEVTLRFFGVHPTRRTGGMLSVTIDCSGGVAQAEPRIRNQEMVAHFGLAATPIAHAVVGLVDAAVPGDFVMQCYTEPDWSQASSEQTRSSADLVSVNEVDPGFYDVAEMSNAPPPPNGLADTLFPFLCP